MNKTEAQAVVEVVERNAAALKLASEIVDDVDQQTKKAAVLIPAILERCTKLGFVHDGNRVSAEASLNTLSGALEAFDDLLQLVETRGLKTAAKGGGDVSLGRGVDEDGSPARAKRGSTFQTREGNRDPMPASDRALCESLGIPVE